MNRIKLLIMFVICLGVFTLIAGGIAHLALADIFHGEADLAFEWRIVQLAALTVAVFVILSLVTLGKTLKLLKA